LKQIHKGLILVAAVCIALLMTGATTIHPPSGNNLTGGGNDGGGINYGDLPTPTPTRSVPNDTPYPTPSSAPVPNRLGLTVRGSVFGPDDEIHVTITSDVPNVDVMFFYGFAGGNQVVSYKTMSVNAQPVLAGLFEPVHIGADGKGTAILMLAPGNYDFFAQSMDAHTESNHVPIAVVGYPS
jgi:hypothetical protein